MEGFRITACQTWCIFPLSWNRTQADEIKMAGTAWVRFSDDVKYHSVILGDTNKIHKIKFFAFNVFFYVFIDILKQIKWELFLIDAKK